MLNKNLLAAAAALAITVAPAASVFANEHTGYCKGLNDCKGKGECAGMAQNDCKGKNDCKGQGYMKMSPKDCVAKGGTPAAAESMPK